MMDHYEWKLHREELIREVEQARLAKALRGSRKRRGSGWRLSLSWEFGRHAGRLRKLFGSRTKTGH